MPVNAKVIARPDVEEADIGRGEVMPGDGADEWAEEERDQIIRLEPLAPRTVGAGIDPGERHAEYSGKRRRTGTNKERIDERLRDDAVGEKRPIVVKPPASVESTGVKHLEAADNEREQRQQHRHRNDRAHDQGCDRFLGDQASDAARNSLMRDGCGYCLNAHGLTTGTWPAMHPAP